MEMSVTSEKVEDNIKRFGVINALESGLAFCLLGKPGLDKKNARPDPVTRSC